VVLRFFFRDGSAVDGAQEVVQQALSRRGVVENISDERGLRGLRHKISEPFGSLV
jgi:hypothetical protein